MDRLPFDSEEIQEEVLSVLLKNPAHFSKVSPDIFTDPVKELICFYAQRYIAKYQNTPSYSHLRLLLEQNVNGDVLPRALKIIDKVFSIKASKFIIDQLASFIRFCEMKKLTSDLAETLEENHGSLIEKNEAFEILARADKIARIENINTGIGSPTFKGFEDTIYNLSERTDNAVPTLFSRVDNRMRGGLFPGTLTLILGATGRGKSVFLVNLAVAAACYGCNVLYCTLELSEDDVKERLYLRMSGTTWEDLRHRPDHVVEQVKKKTKYYSPRGEIHVKSYQSPTIANIRETIRSYEIQGVSIDYLILDYADLMRPLSMRYDAKRHDLDTIFQEIREYALEKNIVTVTVSQLNREGAGKKKPSLRDMSEGWSKAFTCDNAFLFHYNDKIKLIEFFADKLRKGATGWSVKMEARYQSSWIRELTDEELEALEDKQQETKKQKKNSNEISKAEQTERIEKIRERYNKDPKTET